MHVFLCSIVSYFDEFFFFCGFLLFDCICAQSSREKSKLCSIGMQPCCTPCHQLGKRLRRQQSSTNAAVSKISVLGRVSPIKYCDFFSDSTNQRDPYVTVDRLSKVALSSGRPIEVLSLQDVHLTQGCDLTV